MKAEGGKKKLRLNLRTKSMLLFVGLFVLLIAALWLINRFGLQPYYLKQQLVRMEEARTQLTQLAQNPGNEAGYAMPGSKDSIEPKCKSVSGQIRRRRHHR